MGTASSIIFQSARLGGLPVLLKEFGWAEELLSKQEEIGRVYGVSGGALVALGFALARSAQLSPARWGKACNALAEISTFLRTAQPAGFRRFNLNFKYGFTNLQPLRRWLAGRLQVYLGQSDLYLSELPVPLYLGALDQDGTLVLFGSPDPALTFQYRFVQVGPPQDAPVVDAVIAALSTLLSTEPARVNHAWYRDCRPAVVDAGAIVADLEATNPRPILRSRPFTPFLNWKPNWFTSSFIMHRYHERNQPILATYYLDLLERQRSLQSALKDLSALSELPAVPEDQAVPELPVPPQAYHIDLPYIGSTEAYTNMRDSVAHKDDLMQRFGTLLEGQLDSIPFDQPANLIYGAGGFSGILAGLVTTRAVTDGFSRGGGQIQQIYGVSAGVINGFFHAVTIAAERHPDLYRPPARKALADLEAYIGSIELNKVLKFNTNPARFWRGWANLSPLKEFILERLATYTGSAHPEQLRFDDIALPMTITCTRHDGFPEFFGMTAPDRKMLFAGQPVSIRPAYIIDAILAGWSMNTYVEPARIDGEEYEDGGGAFYDIGLFPACLDPQLTNLINIHLDEPEGHSYHLPPRPDLVRIVFDTHNYNFPEERRRMFFLTNLLYEHYAWRARYANYRQAAPLPSLSPDFRREWVPTSQYHEEA